MGGPDEYDEEQVMNELVERFLEREMVSPQVQALARKLQAEGRIDEALNVLVEARKRQRKQ